MEIVRKLMRTNPNTGEQYQEVQFMADLLAINEAAPQKNVNGTIFYVATIGFKNAKEEYIQTPAQIWEANLQRAKEVIGQRTLCTVQKVGDDFYFKASHLVSGVRATAEDLGDIFEGEFVEEQVEQESNAPVNVQS